MKVAYLVVAALALVATGCSRSATSDGTARTAAGPVYDRDAISAEELERRSTGDMYDVVLALRPNWLRPPGTGPSSGKPMVYLDGRRVGSVEALRQISAPSVAYARYYTISQAQNRFGKLAMHPAIDITTKSYPEE